MEQMTDVLVSLLSSVVLLMLKKSFFHSFKIFEFLESVGWGSFQLFDPFPNVCTEIWVISNFETIP